MMLAARNKGQPDLVYTRNVKRHIVLLIVLIVVFSLTRLEARQNRISLGVVDGWNDLATVDGVRIVEGKRGFADIVLLDGEYAPDENTDMLLHFDYSAIDVMGRYTTVEGGGQTSTRMSRIGAGVGVFEGQGVALSPRPGSMFSPGVSWGDFSIEFWLYPATLGEGDTIVLWESSRRRGNRLIPQEVRCSIRGRRLTWQFENVFMPADHSEKTIVITGRTGLIPRSWRHHLLRFDSSIGLLEYLIDGIPEAITHVTSSGYEGDEQYVPLTGRAIEGDLRIGSTLNGLLDEFRISKSFIEKPFVETYAQRTGTAMSRVFDLEYSNSRLASIEAEIDTPGDTEVLFYYRLGEDFRSRSEVIGPWISFRPGDVFLSATRGRYLQILIELLPDGLGQETPSVSTIEILYEPDLPPHAPSWVEVDPDDGSLSVSWRASADSDVAGYLVYYGDRPGQYFGTDSSTGVSPIDVGPSTEVSLEGLSNGRLYYVAVVSYDAGSPPHISGFSRETAARPSNIHRRK